MDWIDLAKEIPWLGTSNIRLKDQDSEQKLCNAFSQHGFKILTIEGETINSEISFFSEISRVLNFPAYFENNWDAFNDCFEDFSAQQKKQL